MNNYLTYSVLEYRHSLGLGESLNVGILFYFPEENVFEFVHSDGYRAKAIYPDFDNSLFNAYLKAISSKVKKPFDLLKGSSIDSDFAKYIHKYILAEDAAGLIFREPVNVKNVFADRKTVINDFSKLLLPGVNIKKPIITKHNENYILTQFNGYVFGEDKSLKNNFKINQIIETKHTSLKFELSWKKDTNNFIKPINFDLNEDASFQYKAAAFYGYLSDLNDYARSNNSRFDFLISRPQDTIFNRAFENAMDFLDSSKTPKKLLTEDQWKDYSLDIISEFSTN
jgi:hypothetical protein